jgi:cation-transporting ATPase 13A3/4/5
MFTTSPQKVNVSGRVTTFVFDKTGTLTDENLQLKGILPVMPGQNQFLGLVDESSLKEHKTQIEYEKILEGMASCHGVLEINGSKIGDPLEIAMMETTNWNLSEKMGVISV